MGKKTKAKSNKKGHAKRGSERKAAPTTTTLSLVASAESSLSEMQMENALAYYEEALSMDPFNNDIMDSLADVYLSMGETRRSLELLLASAQISPENNPEKYLYIAQLQQGREALSSYQQALYYLQQLRQSSEDVLATTAFDKQLVKSYCGMAELYLTDLCYDENAEHLCEESIMQALSIDPKSIDASHALANIRLSQSRPIDAAELVEGVFKIISAIREHVNSRTVLEDLRSPETHDKVMNTHRPDVPSLEICISTVKMMLECAAIKPSFAEDALLFSADLLNDDDENIELWYIAGIAAMSTTPPDFTVATYYFEQAKSMIESLKELPDFQDGVIDEHYSLIVDHLSMIHSQQEGQKHFAVSNQTATSGLEVQEWSSDEEESDKMDI